MEPKQIIIGACATYGAICLSYRLYAMLGYFNRNYLRWEANHYAKYAKVGKDSWVVVTGGSDGIGLEICKQMA